MVEYYYDAWGNHKVVDEKGDEITDQNNIGNLNPFRYRGYYYDTETGLYFLQTRYYDPEVGRFLNRDSVQYADPETINGLNLYAYCLNNPVEYVDPTGHFPIWLAALAIGTFVSGLISGTTNAIQTAINGGSGAEIWASFAENAITGAAMGFAMTLGGIAAIYFGAAATVVSGLVSIAVGFGAGIGAYWAGGRIRGEDKLSWVDAIGQGIVTGFAAFNSFGVGYMMGTLGLFNNLIKGKGFTGFINAAKGLGYTGLKSLIYAGMTYINSYKVQMIIRSIFKSLFTSPYLNKILN